jgi:hypothetical protein
MDDWGAGRAVYCVACGQTSHFARPPVELKTSIGARRRLIGRCATCGQKISAFLSSEDGPTVHAVRVGTATKRELERASHLLEISQRAVVENVLREYLADFVTAELERLAAGGLITGKEHNRRQEQLAQPIESWTPPEQTKSLSE